MPSNAQWQLVPAQPTVEMVAAWHRQKNRGTQEVGAPENNAAKSDFAAYAAMLAVAPAPPAVPPAGELLQLCQRLNALLANASPQPWVYRSDEFDDWGIIRGPLRNDRGIGPFRPIVAVGKDSLVTEQEMDQHRRARTDPYGPNAQLITEAVNALPQLLAAVLNQLEQPRGVD
jgi:hypothetical protein